MNTATSSPARCTWMRMPSSFTSTMAGTPVAASAAATSGALDASIGASGRPTVRLNSASAPPVSAAAATSLRSPESSSARRTAVGGNAGGLGDRVGEQPGLGALPQLTAEQPDEHALLVGGGRREKSVKQATAPACEPRPATTEIAAMPPRRPRPRSASARRRAAAGRAGWRSRRRSAVAAAHRRGRRRRRRARGLGGSAASRRRQPASRSILAWRPEVAATAAEVAARSANSTDPSSTAGATDCSRVGEFHSAEAPAHAADGALGVLAVLLGDPGGQAARTVPADVLATPRPAPDRRSATSDRCRSDTNRASARMLASS